MPRTDPAKGRLERDLLTGGSSFVDDIHPEGVLYLHVVRSVYPHARVVGVSTSDAERDGVAVLTEQTIRREFGEIALPADSLYGPNVVRMPPLAREKVNFVGQPIVGVITEGRYDGEDVAEKVSVDYEPLEPVLDARRALAGGPVIHGDRGSNISVRTTLGSGDVDEIFGRAEKVVEDDDLYVHRVAPSPIETRGAIARYDGTRFTIWASCQGVYTLRAAMSQALRLPADRFHIIQPSVGGAFGSKSPAHPEYVLCCLAAKITGRPIKWIESRGENLLATHHGRDARASLSVAATRDGKVQAIRGRILADIGAYNFSINANYPAFVAQLTTGPYRIESARIEATGVFTNKTPTGPYRGAGRPEGAFFIERMLDLLAEDLGIDPAVVRARNLIPQGSMPYTTPLGLTIDVSDYPRIFTSALESLGYERWKMWASRMKRGGRLAGVGLADYAEVSRASIGESADLRIAADGAVRIAIGSGPHGHGLKSIAARVAAEELELDESAIEVLAGDSDLAPSGVGTFGSRGTTVGGGAVVEACREVKARALEEASKVFGCPPQELKFESFGVRRAGRRERISMPELAGIAGEMHSFKFYSAKDVYAFGVHLAVVEVDRGTGRTKVVHYGAVDDVGRAINRRFVEGQVFGGVLQGLSQVLYEGVRYNQDGQPLAGSIADAGVPTAVEHARVSSQLVEYPSSLPHRVRGVGEAGPMGGLASVVRAIEDAVGVRLSTTDLNSEFIWRLIRK